MLRDTVIRTAKKGGGIFMLFFGLPRVGIGSFMKKYYEQ